MWVLRQGTQAGRFENFYAIYTLFKGISFVKEQFVAVLSSEVRQYLEGLGLVAELDSGRLRCRCCEAAISADNFGGLIRHRGELMFACSKDACLLNLGTTTEINPG